MSYILDALRKSEYERQVAAGQGVGMLYPIEIQRDRKQWLPIGIVVLIIILTCALIWWLWSQLQSVDTKVYSATNKPVTVVATQLPTALQKVIPEPEPVAEAHIPAIAQKKIRSISIADAEPKPLTQSEAKSTTTTATSQVANIDPLKDLPALNITGYIHNEQGGSLAMINNQLVREGEEVSSGLRLVKILDNSAIFSYKGYVFSR